MRIVQFPTMLRSLGALAQRIILSALRIVHRQDYTKQDQVLADLLRPMPSMNLSPHYSISTHSDLDRCFGDDLRQEVDDAMYVSAAEYSRKLLEQEMIL